MKEEKMTVDEVYRELKGDIDTINHNVKDIKDDIKGMATKDEIAALREEISKLRTWVVSVFIGAVVVLGTLIGAFVNMTIAVLS